MTKVVIHFENKKVISFTTLKKKEEILKMLKCEWATYVDGTNMTTVMNISKILFIEIYE